MWIYYGHNHLAALLIFSIPLAFYLALKYWQIRKIRLLVIFIYCLLVVSFFFTLARAAMIALFFSCLLSILIFGRSFKVQRKLVLLTGGLMIIFIFSFGLFASKQYLPTKKHFITLNQKYSRVVYWRQAIDNFSHHPLTGTGLDTFRIINARETPKKYLRTYYSHNFFLQTLSDTGIFGGVLSVLLIATLLWQCLKTVFSESHNRSRFFYLTSFIGILSSTTLALFDMNWSLPSVFLFFWIFAAMIIKRHT